MAIRPEDVYPGQTTSGDGGYPDGKAQNDVTERDGQGSPLEKSWVNDLWGFLQSLTAFGSITPSGNPDEVGASQYLEGVIAVITEYVLGTTGTLYTNLLQQIGDDLLPAAPVSIPLAFTENNLDRFDYLSASNGPAIRQVSVASGGAIVIPIDLKLGTYRILANGINVYVKGDSGHGALPATMPTVSLYNREFDGVTPPANATLVATATDDSADAAAYEIYHPIGLTFATIDPIDPRDQYYLQITGEAGANSQVALDIYAALITLGYKT